MTLLCFSCTAPSPNVLSYSPNRQKRFSAITLVHFQQIKQPALFYSLTQNTPSNEMQNQRIEKVTSTEVTASKSNEFAHINYSNSYLCKLITHVQVSFFNHFPFRCLWKYKKNNSHHSRLQVVLQSTQLSVSVLALCDQVSVKSNIYILQRSAKGAP